MIVIIKPSYCVVLILIMQKILITTMLLSKVVDVDIIAYHHYVDIDDYFVDYFVDDYYVNLYFKIDVYDNYVYVVFDDV